MFKIRATSTLTNEIVNEYEWAEEAIIRDLISSIANEIRIAECMEIQTITLPPAGNSYMRDEIETIATVYVLSPSEVRRAIDAIKLLLVIGDEKTAVLAHELQRIFSIQLNELRK